MAHNVQDIEFVSRTNIMLLRRYMHLHAPCSSHTCHVAMQELVSHVISSHVEGQGSKGAAHTMLKLQSSYSRWRDAVVRMQS